MIAMVTYYPDQPEGVFITGRGRAAENLSQGNGIIACMND
jgi:hypothetical protein